MTVAKRKAAFHAVVAAHSLLNCPGEPVEGFLPQLNQGWLAMVLCFAHHPLGKPCQLVVHSPALDMGDQMAVQVSGTPADWFALLVEM